MDHIPVDCIHVSHVLIGQSCHVIIQSRDHFITQHPAVLVTMAYVSLMIVFFCLCPCSMAENSARYKYVSVFYHVEPLGPTAAFVLINTC